MLVHTISTMLAAGAMLAAAGPALAQDAPLRHAMDDPALQWGPCPEFMPAGCQIAVLRGDPAEPNADVLFKVPGGAEIPRHWHGSAERMVLLGGELEARYDGHPAVTLKRGDYGYGPPKLPHSAHCRSSDPCVLFIAFVGPVDAHAGEPGN